MARSCFLLHLLLLLQASLLSNAYSKLSDTALKNIQDAGDDFNIHTGALLAPILIPRVPGSEGSSKVLHHLADFFKTNLPQWEITFHNSTSRTPATGDSDIPFVNMIATRDPPWASPGEISHLTLAAHYDSKLTPHGFIGATDSAAPCAMLLHMARALDTALSRKWTAMLASGSPDPSTDDAATRGLQILFLDGEESFLEWTETDSLYGARALADAWEHTPHPALATFRSPLAAISLFVLLDLLGAPRPRVPSYYKTTHWAYQHMAALELRLRALDLFKSATISKKPFLNEANKKSKQWLGTMIADDHVPFMRRGVEVFHLIASPFPRVWHEMDDDGAHLDLPTVEDWAKLVTAFVAEWMELDAFLGVAVTPQKRESLAHEELA